MGLIDYFRNFFDSPNDEFIKESLGNLKKRVKEYFDIPSCNIWVIPDESKISRTGYVEIPKKDNVGFGSLEEVVTKFYSDAGFKTKERLGDYSFKFLNNDKSKSYSVKILKEERNYCLDVDGGKTLNNLFQKR